MVQLQIASEAKAGARITGLRVPFHVGCSSEADVRIDEPGVFPRHFQVYRQGSSFICLAEPDALLRINGTPVRQSVLRNGDVIEIGALKIEFALTPARQQGLALREWLTWAGLGALCALQIALIYWLNR